MFPQVDKIVQEVIDQLKSIERKLDRLIELAELHIADA